MSQNTHRAAKNRRKTKGRPIAVAAAFAAAMSFGTPALTAQAAEFTELTTKWVNAPASVPNLTKVDFVSHYNVNDDLGVEGVKENNVVTYTIAHGAFYSLPSACKTTDGLNPTSFISADKTTLTCNLGALPYGTAVTITGSASAVGNNGEQLTLGSVSNGQTASVVPILITATPNIDVVQNGGIAWKNDSATANLQLEVPVGVSIGSGNELIDTTKPVSFQISVAPNGSGSVNPIDALELSANPCAPFVSVPGLEWRNALRNAGNGISSTIPWSVRTGQDDISAAQCTVTKTAPGVWTVTVSGFPQQPQAVRLSSTGSQLPVDRQFLTSLSLFFTSSQPMFTEPRENQAIKFDVSNVTATTITGAQVAETGDGLTNNDSNVIITGQGTQSSGFIRTGIGVFMNTLSEASAARFATDYADIMLPGGLRTKGTSARGTMWDDTGRTTNNGLEATQNSMDAYAGQDYQMFAGEITTQTQYFSPDAKFRGIVIASLLPNYPETGFMEYSLDNGATWVRFPNPVAGMSQTINFLEAVPGVDPATVTALRMGYSPGEKPSVPDAKWGVQRSVISGDGNSMATRSDFYAFVTPLDAVGAKVWTSGSWEVNGVTKASAATEPQITAIAGSDFPYTSGERDVLTIVSARPSVAKTVDAGETADANIGDTLTYTLKPSLSTDSGVQSASNMGIKDTLGANQEYVEGSASLAPTSVTKNADGTTTLIWDLPNVAWNDANVPAITYQSTVTGNVPGNRTNTAYAFSDEFPLKADGTGSAGSSSTAVAVLATGQTYLEKKALSPEVAVDGGSTWIITDENKSATTQDTMDIIDILPYTGDKNGSKVTGTITYDTPVVTQLGGADKITIWYATAAPATIAGKPSDPSNGAVGAPSALWTSTKPADGSTITAIRIIAENVPFGGKIGVELPYTTDGMAQDDRLTNIAYSQSTTTELQMIKSASTTVLKENSQLQIAKQMVTAPTAIKQGGEVEYTLTAHNAGTGTANNVIVTDTNGSSLEDIAPKGALPQGTWNADTNTWNVGDIPAGGTVVLNVVGTVKADADLSKPIFNDVVIANPSFPKAPITPEDVDVDPATKGQINNPDAKADTDQFDGTQVQALTSLGGIVFNDSVNTSTSNTPDTGERLYEGVVVELLDSTGKVIASTTTDKDGKYNFPDLIPGVYTTKIAVPEEGADNTTTFGQTTPGLVSGTIDISSGVPIEIVNFGVYKPASLGDTVFTDTNGDGIQNADETGIPEVGVQLFQADGVTPVVDIHGKPVAATVTDKDGKYSFTGLHAGDYVVKFVAPDGSFITVPTVGDDRAVDSNADQLTGLSAPVTLTEGQNDPTIDAGIIVPTPALELVKDGEWVENDTNAPDAPVAHKVGEVINYSFTITNTGNVPEGDVKPNDPKVVDAKPATDEDAAKAKLLLPGQSVKFTGTYTVTQSDIDAQQVVNTATAVGQPLSPLPGNKPLEDPENPGTPVAPIVTPPSTHVEANKPQPKLTLTKKGEWANDSTVADKVRVVGEELVYHFTVTNEGDVTISNIVVDDPKLAGQKITITCTDVVLAPGASTDCEALGYKATQDDLYNADGTRTVAVVNVATANGDAPPAPKDPYAPAGDNNPVVPQPKVVTNEAKSNQPQGPTGTWDGTLYLDANRSNLLDDGETFFPGVRINLLDENGAVVATTTTDDKGYYKFTDLVPGKYHVEVVNPPAGFDTTQLSKQVMDVTAEKPVVDMNFGYVNETPTVDPETPAPPAPPSNPVPGVSTPVPPVPTTPIVGNPVAPRTPVSVPVSVTPPQQVVSTPTVLARTGTEAAGMIGGSLALFAAGLALFGISRKRKAKNTIVEPTDK